jgi:tetratricopeptide (TPR) repeat protein
LKYFRSGVIVSAEGAMYCSRLLPSVCVCLLAFLPVCLVAEDDPSLPSSPARREYRLGYAALQKGDYQSAIRHFNLVILLRPSSARAYYARGCTYFKMKECDGAIADFTSAIGLDPDYDKAYRARASAHSRQGNRAESAKDTQMAMQIWMRRWQQAGRPGAGRLGAARLELGRRDARVPESVDRGMMADAMEREHRWRHVYGAAGRVGGLQLQPR